MNLYKTHKTYNISGLFTVRYIKNPMKLLQYVSSTFLATSSLHSSYFLFMGVLISLQFSILNFLRISIAYIFRQMKNSSFPCVISIPRKYVIRPRSDIAKACTISSLNSSISFSLLPAIKGHQHKDKQQESRYYYV